MAKIIGRKILPYGSCFKTMLRNFPYAFAVITLTMPLFAGVNPDGSYSETIPIELPPARQNLQPQVALTYNSNAGSGIAGVGWNLTGVQAISRIPNQNGILFQGGDTFAGPGGRLIDVTPDKSRFVGENFDGSNYYPQGVAGDAPASWIVKGNDGRAYYYGDTSDSFLLARKIDQSAINGSAKLWALSRIEDQWGNYIEYKYDQNEGQIYLKQIRYNKSIDGSRYHAIDIRYETRTDEIANGIGGFSRTLRRIAEISVTSGILDYWPFNLFSGDVIRRYQLGYELSPASSRSRLKTLSILSPTQSVATQTFTYSGQAERLTADTKPALSGGHMYNDAQDWYNYRTLSGDFNGDGLTDFATVARAASYTNGFSSNIFMELSSPNGSYQSVPWPAALGGNLLAGVLFTTQCEIFSGDFNGDGLSDIGAICLPEVENGWSHNVFVELSTGSGFESRAWLAGIPWHMHNTGGHISDFKILTGDFDGDGRTDIAALKRGSISQGWSQFIYVELSTGSGFTPEARSSQIAQALTYQGMSTSGFNKVEYEVTTGDFNGDGRTDIAAVAGDVMIEGGPGTSSPWAGKILVDYSTGHTFHSVSLPASFPQNIILCEPVGLMQAPPLFPCGSFILPKKLRMLPGDFNGDGVMDLAIAPLGGAVALVNEFSMLLGTQEGFLSQNWPSVLFGHMRNGGSTSTDHNLIPIDINHDGKTDIMAASRSVNGTNGWGSRFYTNISSGWGFSDGELPSILPGHMFNNGIGNVFTYNLTPGDFSGHGAISIASIAKPGNGALVVTGVTYPDPLNPTVPEFTWGPGSGFNSLMFVEHFVWEKADLLIGLNSSNGIVANIEYASYAEIGAAQRINTCAGGTATGYGGDCGNSLPQGSYVVKSVFTQGNMDLDQNGLSDFNQINYAYQNPRYIPGGYGVKAALGFQSITTTNATTGNYSVQTFQQAKPFTGSVSSNVSYLKVNGSFEKVTENIAPALKQYACNDSGCYENPDPNFAGVRQRRAASLSVTYALSGGVVEKVQTQEVMVFDSFGNPTLTHESVNSGHTTKNIYKIIQYATAASGDLSDRALGLPASEKLCREANSCTPGDQYFIGETKMYYDNLPLGQHGTKRAVTKKETYAITGTNTGVWLAETYEYDTAGNVIDTTDAMGVRTEIQYDSLFNQYPVMVTKSHGNRMMQTVSTYDTRFGKAWHTKDLETGNETYLSIDDTGFVYAQETRNGSTVLARSTFAHSAFGSTPAWSQSCKHYGSTFSQSACTKKIADAFGRTYREEFPELVAGIETQMAVEHRYDAEGHEVQVSQPFKAAESATQWNEKKYDPYSRHIETITFDNRHAKTEYDTVNSCVTATGFDRKRKKTCSNIDGKPVITYDAAQTPNQYTTVSYIYDARGRLTETDAPQGPTYIDYVDNSGLQKYIIDPVAGRTDYDYYFTSGTPSFGKLKTETRGGYITTFEYNATFGRTSKVTRSTSSGQAPANILETTTYIYDQNDVSFGKGKLTTLTHVKDGFTIIERYSYNAKGETTQTTRRIAHATETLCADVNAMPCLQVFGKTTDELGRVKTMLYPDGKQSSVEYVSQLGSYVSSIKHDGVTYATYGDYTYDVGVHVGKVTYGNGIEQSYAYEANTGLLKTTKIGLPAQPSLLDIGYTYNESMNISRIDDRVVTELSTNFEYDAHNRLQSATLDSGVTRTYKFDRDGQKQSQGNLELKDKRRMTYAPSPSNSEKYLTYPASDEVFNSDTNHWQPNQAFTWSATGSLLTKGPFTFTYDSNNMMTSAIERENTTSALIVGESKFFYDQSGQRFLKTHTRNGITIKTWYLGDGIEIREKFIGSSSGSFDAVQATKYIYGIDDKKLASITGSVQTSQLSATASGLFALADGFSSRTITGLASKTFYTFYGIYAHASTALSASENTGKAFRIGGLSLAAIFLILWLILSHPTPSPSPLRGEGSEYGLVSRATALVMLFAFISVNCGTGNVPGSTPIDLSGPGPGSIGAAGDATTAAAPSNAFISALYTGLPTGTVYYSHNHLGSGALVTDASGNEIFRITYTEYGEIDLENSGKWNSTTEEFERSEDDALIAITAVKYTGQEYDPETGFYYYNARYYDPQLGIFTTADSEFDSAQGNFAYNRHMYVRGNPIMYTDPSGHSFWAVFAALVGIGGVPGAFAAGGAAIRGAATNDWSTSNLWKGAGQGLAAMAAIGAGIATGGAAFTAYGGAAGGLSAAVAGGVAGGAAGGFVGGSTNTWLNGGSFGEGLAMGVVGGVFGAMAGAAGGFAGYGMGVLAGNGFWGSVATGAAAGFGGGFTGGVLGGLAQGRSFGDAMLDGLTAGAIGGLIGGAVGALSYRLNQPTQSSKGEEDGMLITDLINEGPDRFPYLNEKGEPRYIEPYQTIKGGDYDAVKAMEGEVIKTHGKYGLGPVDVIFHENGSYSIRGLSPRLKLYRNEIYTTPKYRDFKRLYEMPIYRNRPIYGGRTAFG